MTVRTTMIPDHGPESVNAPSLPDLLEEGLRAHFGQLVRITRLERSPLETFKTHPIERVDMILESGERLRVIFKRLDHSREVLVYRRLLSGRRFGAPALYASVCDEARGLYWLFLEDVGEQTLKHGEREDWLAAVRWLAQMHAAYLGREEELQALGCLHEQGPDYYQAMVEMARANLHLAGAGPALDRLETLLERFDAVIARLTRLPLTLVHGSLSRHNVAIQSDRKIRLFDWETAAIGSPAWDLAHLLAGWKADKPAFVAAYLGAFTPPAGVPFDAGAFQVTCLHYGKVLNVLRDLRRSAEACRDAKFVEQTLTGLETAWCQLDWEDAHD